MSKGNVSKTGITLLAICGLFMGSMILSQTNVSARHVRRTYYTCRRKAHHRSKGLHIKRPHKVRKHMIKRHGRKLRNPTRARRKPRTLKVERCETGDAISVQPKGKEK